MEIKREIIEKDGLKSYFFSNVLLNAVYNEEELCSNSEKVNPVAAFFTGLTEEKPSNDQVAEILTARKDNFDSLHTAVDTFFALGKDYKNEFDKFGSILRENGKTHEIYELARVHGPSVDNALAALVRKTTMQKSQVAPFLSLLYKLNSLQSPNPSFDADIALFGLDLFWDAYAFIKLGVIEAPQSTVDEVRSTICQTLAAKHPKLADLIQNGPKVDEEAVYQRLIQKPISSVHGEVAECVVKQVRATIQEIQVNGSGCHQKDQQVLTDSLAQSVDRFFYVIVRLLTASEVSQAKMFYDIIPNEFRNIAFGYLEAEVFKTAVLATDEVIQAFLRGSSKRSTSLTFSALLRSDLYEVVTNDWKKSALCRILYKFKLCVKQNLSTPILPEIVESSNEGLVELVLSAIEFTMWIVENYGKEQDDRSKRSLLALNSNAITSISASIDEALRNSTANDNILRAHLTNIRQALSALPKNVGASNNTNESNVATSVHKVAPFAKNDMEYSKETIQALHSSTGVKDYQSTVMKGIIQTDSITLVHVPSVAIGDGVFKMQPLVRNSKSGELAASKEDISSDREVCSCDASAHPIRTDVNQELPKSETEHPTSDENVSAETYKALKSESEVEVVTNQRDNSSNIEFANNSDKVTSSQTSLFSNQDSAFNNQGFATESQQGFTSGDHSFDVKSQSFAKQNSVASGDGGNEDDDEPQMQFQTGGGFGSVSQGFASSKGSDFGSNNGFGASNNGGFNGGSRGPRGAQGGFKGGSGTFAQSRGRGGPVGGGGSRF